MSRTSARRTSRPPAFRTRALLGLHERATGWIAASETYLAGEWVGRAYQWLLDYPPVARDRAVDAAVVHPAAPIRYHGLVAALSPMNHVRPGAGS